MESNLQLPYKVLKSAEWDYTFTTKHGIIYHAYFIDFNSYHPNFRNVYTFNIEPASNEPHPIDTRIALTVVSILMEFFTTKENAMIMVCDNLDGKEKKREILFQRWFKNYNDGRLVRFDASANTEDYTLYVSIYLRKDNPKISQLIQSFYELIGNDMYPI